MAGLNKRSLQEQLRK